MQTIKSANDLKTSKNATVDGFAWQANEKIKNSGSYIKTANYFHSKIDNIKSIKDIIKDPLLYEFATKCCALSTKSLGHISAENIEKIFNKLIDIDSLQDEEYKLQLLTRYYLTCGDSLGGKMRNIIGRKAQTTFTNQIHTMLKALDNNPQAITNGNDKITQLNWKNRTIIFDKKPEFIGKSIDVILLGYDDDADIDIHNPSQFIACGELKGGIDPAGADEHFKTAATALRRVNIAFDKIKKPKPALFFVGAAIESAMADELYNKLENNEYTFVANLTKQEQVDELITSLISL